MRSGTKHTTGPPRGRGRYSDDGGTWWWDHDQQRWYRTTADHETLEIELEDFGGTSFVRSIATTLTSQHGAQSYRFVGRARSADPRWQTYDITSGTFPVLPLELPLDQQRPGSGFGDESRARLRELEERLASEGWRLSGHGAHWWCKRYTRPDLDWASPANAHP